jgi:hypothetical protein
MFFDESLSAEHPHNITEEGSISVLIVFTGTYKYPVAAKEQGL